MRVRLAAVRASTDRLPLAVAIDTAVVVAFVAIGRRDHGEDPGIAGLAGTAAPFLVGLLVAWLVAGRRGEPTAIRTGLIVWPITVVVGLLGRRVVGEGTALAFVLVATCFLGATLLGWRAIASLVERRRRPA